MNRLIAINLCLIFAAALSAQDSKPDPGLLDVKRIYVGELGTNVQATALRELIIASLNSTKLFILTENEARADAVLKGAADDKTFTDTYDTYEGMSGHESLGKSASGSTLTGKVSGLYGANSIGDNESHHSRERKHEAYASVRLCSKDGDVLWSTTQESLGAKFRSASADVAAKIAHQITLDYDRALRAETTPPTTAPAPSKKPTP
jgi:hypothetical protein